MQDKRKLMQIGFAALLARKQAVNKQYVYESRGDGGFVFEPILRNNQPELADEEYMRKKYYSQIVYQAAQLGDLQTTIDEPNVDKKAARRLWAGRKGTGWAGTGKGGYMQSLQPGVPETVGTGLGTAAKESDLLMQTYLNYQSKKMHMLKGKSQQATADLFKKIVDHSRKNNPDASVGSSPYTPSPKDQGIPFNEYAAYLRPEMAYEVPPANATPAQQKEWVKQAHIKLDTYLNSVKYKPENKLASTLGFVQGQYAQKLAEMKPEHFGPAEMRRLLASDLGRQPAGGDRPVQGKEGMLKGVGGLYEDWETVDAFGDYEDERETYGPGVTVTGPSKNEGSDFSGDGGALTSNNMEIADANLLRTTFKKETIDQLFPKAYQQWRKEQHLDFQRALRNDPDLMLNQSLYKDAAQVPIKNWAEAETFIRWMQKTINDEQSKLNELIPQYDDFGLPDYKSKGVWKSKQGIGDSGNYSKRGGFTAIEEGGTQQFLAGTNPGARDYKAEIVRGLMGDFGLLNDEAKYLMSNRFGMISGDYTLINREAETRGVDFYLPQSGGLLKVHVSARVVPGTKNSRPYVKIDIPYPSQRNNFTGGVTFIPDVEMQLNDMEILEMKGQEGLNAHNLFTEEFWSKGSSQQYAGFSMLTQNGEATRMFMGAGSPVNSVAFFTSTISTGDFAQQLKGLVDISAEEWWGHPTGFGGYFNLSDMDGGAFKEWAMRWEEESQKIQDDINHRIEAKWKMWVSQYAGGGVTAAPPTIAKAWAAPIKLGPFVHSTKYLGQAQNVGRRPHGYYLMED